MEESIGDFEAALCRYTIPLNEVDQLLKTKNIPKALQILTDLQQKMDCEVCQEVVQEVIIALNEVPLSCTIECPSCETAREKAVNRIQWAKEAFCPPPPPARG
jgi:hypothetical protein